jgi:hypothetical protein
VIDHYCVDCHARKRTEGKNAVDLSGAIVQEKPGAPLGRWSASYWALAPLGFCYGEVPFTFEKGSRSIPGKMGARGSKLFGMLEGGHHDVKLPAEDLRHITLWLDCGSDFYGEYHDLEAQARGEHVSPELE